MTARQQIVNLHNRTAALGLSFEETETLRRAQMTLRRWGELECGNGNDYASWLIERDETTNKPYLVTHPRQGKSYRRPVADREAGALKRIAAILKNHPKLGFYHQGDPRGCALYVGKLADIPKPVKANINSHYTRWIACC